jgi:hypothetical protein
MRFIKIYFLILIFIFLSGCIQSTALLGPGVTLATTGNIMQAGLQYGANSAIKKETGKDPITYVKDIVEEDKKNRKFKKDFSAMVEKRIKVAREKIIIN